MHYSLLYRGPLSSCNYGCDYCPFAKRTETHAELAGDRASLSRFLSWCQQQQHRGNELSILFTPWGEALIRSWYQDALAELSNLPHVRRVAIQTNISCQLKWIERCNLDRLALWCTYHPTETTRERFLARCRELDRLGVRYSVGVVGLKEHQADTQWLRGKLRPDVYLWINAFKRQADYYTEADHQLFTAIDPLFPINAVYHPSRGNACRAGHEVFSVDGDGAMRRCHFISNVIGNIYQDDWESSLTPTPCTANTCGCHIGYVHMPKLNLYEVFGEGVLERIPKTQPGWRLQPPPVVAEATTPVLSRRIINLPVAQVSTSGR